MFLITVLGSRVLFKSPIYQPQADRARMERYCNTDKHQKLTHRQKEVTAFFRAITQRVKGEGRTCHMKTETDTTRERERIKKSKINGVFVIRAGWAGGHKGLGAAAINKHVRQSQPLRQEAASTLKKPFVPDRPQLKKKKLYIYIVLHDSQVCNLME